MNGEEAEAPKKESQHQAGDNQLSFLEVVAKVSKEAAAEEWKKHQQEFQAQIVDYGRTVGTNYATQETLPVPVPDITATTIQGKELAVASAKNRSLRTFLQGLGFDILFALVSVIALSLNDFNFLDGAAWATLGILVLKTIIQTAVSYVARLKITPRYESVEPPR